MANAVRNAALERWRHLLGEGAAGGQTDAQLLERFVALRDEASFAGLVRRHGAMVLAICRRVIRHEHDAEDAFQAAFLILARKAGAVRWQPSVGGWLFRVAYRVALKARKRTARTRTRERTVTDMPQIARATPARDWELRALLDEAVSHLPEKYRAAVVLCYVEGKTQEEAGRRLGLSTDAVKGRLRQARALLQKWLRRRGVALSVGALAALAAEEASAVPPAALVVETVRAATVFAANPAAAPASAGAAALATGALTTMSGMRGNVLGVFVLALALCGAAAGWFLRAQAGDRPEEAAEPPALPAPAAGIAPKPEPLPAGAVARLGTARWRHDGAAFFVAFAGQGKQLVTARQGFVSQCAVCHKLPFDEAGRPLPPGEDRPFRVWAVNSGRELRRFGSPLREALAGLFKGSDGHLLAKNDQGVAAVSVALAPDGLTLASADPDAGIRLWDVDTGKLLRQIGGDSTGAVTGLAFAPDGKVLAVQAEGRCVRLYDTATGKAGRHLDDPGPAWRVAWGDGVTFSPDGRFLAAGGTTADGTGALQLWDPATGRKVRQVMGKARGSAAFAFSPDGRTLAWPAKDGTLRLEASATGKELRRLGGPSETGYLAALAFAPDGRVVATRGYDHAIRLWDVATGRRLRQLRPPVLRGSQPFFGVSCALPDHSIAFAPDGKVLAAGTPEGAVQLWDPATGAEVAPGHHGAVVALAVSADGKRVTSLGADQVVREWDAATGQALRSWRLPSGATDTALSADARTAAFRSGGDAIQLWDVAGGRPLHQVRVDEGVRGHCAGMSDPRSMTFAPDGRLLARLAADGVIHVWDPASGRELHTIPTQETVWSLLAAASCDDGVFPWIAFAPGGRLLAVLRPPAHLRPDEDGALYLVDLAADRVVRRFPGIKSGMTPFLFSPDGRTLTLVGHDGTVTLWEVASGSERFRFSVNPADAIRVLASSPDSGVLAGAGADRTIRLWDAWTGKDVGQCQGHAGRIRALAFAAGGKTLVSGSQDSTALVWDVARFVERPGPGNLEAGQAEACWDDLAAAGGRKAFEAMRRLSAAPRQAVPLLRQRLNPVAAPDPGRLARLIADLDSDSFPTRNRASAELDKWGELAGPALRKALAGRPSPETRRRVEHLLGKLETGELAAAGLREVRAVEVLERLGTAEAKELLTRLAGGAPGARLTREADAARRRLAARGGDMP
jgi:RNA polymerase sigma factor (sigma-70 family)